MARFSALFAGLFVLLAGVPASAQSAGPTFPDRVIGQERTPVVIDEYVSLTCPHCADFYINTLPKIEERYVKTGKVRVILHDFPLDNVSLRAAALARCMPAEEFFPFIRILYDNQSKWATAGNPDKILVQYATLGGLDEARAKFCLNDQGMQNQVVAERTQAESQYDVKSTPTFVFNNGVEKMEGAGSIDSFSATIDRMLAHSKK